MTYLGELNIKKALTHVPKSAEINTKKEKLFLSLHGL